MKKILVALLLILTICLGMVSMAGCGGKKEEPKFELEQGITYDGSEVEITFYHTMGANLRSVLDKYIEKFNKLYPNIKITHSQVGSYDDVRDKIATELTVGNQPNIAYCYPDHVALYNLAGAVVTLDELIASKAEVKRADGTTETLGLTDEQIDDFIDAYYKEGTEFEGGKMHTLPLSKSTEVLYYNKTFFDKHGLKVPTTWDEMEDVCAKILKIDPKCIPLGYDSEANWFITMTEQLKTPYTSATGDHFLFNTKENQAFVKRFAEWHKKGYVTTEEIYGSYTSGLFTNLKETEARSYMCIGSSAGASYQRPTKDANGKYPFDVGITTIPQADASNKKVISQGPSLCIFNGTEQEVLASWLFAKYLTTTVEFQAEFSMISGYVPVIESVSEHPVYSNFIKTANGGDNITALSAKVCLDQKDAYYVSPAFNGSSEARDQVGQLLQYCMVQCKTAKDVDAMIDKAFKDAVAECEYMS